ncbi:MAG: sensor domain-containing diguanylate cyclase [Deltaproteobacteria bacterium]|nr:sensor domain-containing diguanylate cyclase [Deltaproteobacteria bacterium]MBW2015781.1 sensor domain-containing diguanylate cyclase [Deltaproteobacteria bacterium]MBW2128665.1 sensor domain-containing diguanylate cyclase [Deltaproteobacteria bacterium]MBW2302644.1 sensor domain-containing diguanylate cyclase [Deltaproteobacteria bacterium]
MRSSGNLDAEDFHKIIERLEYNEDISQRFFEVEVSILSTLNFADFFERLLTEIKEKFDIPYVWLSLIDENDLVPLIGALASSPLLKERLNIIDRKNFLEIVGNRKEPLLVNEDLRPFYRMFPPNEKYLIRSAAILPIFLNQELIGSLNHGDPSAERYVPGMNTTLLERLAVKISICLSNVTAHEKLRILASKDPLTGLLNRGVIEAVMQREVNRALRYDTPLSLIFIDLDDFKTVNDSHGHDAGDALLKYLGSHLVEKSRESDVVGRFAGDEFVILLPSTNSREALKLAQRIKRNLLQNPLKYNGKTIPVSFSYGISHIHDDGVKDPASLVKKADERLYRAKRRKR